MSSRVFDQISRTGQIYLLSPGVMSYYQPNAKNVLPVRLQSIAICLVYQLKYRQINQPNQNKVNNNIFFLTRSLPTNLERKEIDFSISIILYFSDVPEATVRLGTSLDKNSIREGTDVYFDCMVFSHPIVFRIEWRHNVSKIHTYIQTYLRT